MLKRLVKQRKHFLSLATSESEYLKEIRFVAYWSMKSGASYENSCLVSKKNIFVNNIQGISIAALFVL